jgi:hypothetical protein
MNDKSPMHFSRMAGLETRIGLLATVEIKPTVEQPRNSALSGSDRHDSAVWQCLDIAHRRLAKKRLYSRLNWLGLS